MTDRELLELAAKAWQEGYAQGVEDERISEAHIGIAGFGAKVEPARCNPYAAAPIPAPVSVTEWQPIETAPKDGTAILVSDERGAWFAKYEPVYQSGYRPKNPWFSLMLNHDHMRTGKPFAPTHWMPLPGNHSHDVARREGEPP